MPVNTSSSAVIENQRSGAAVEVVLNQPDSSTVTSTPPLLAETEGQNTSILAPTKPFRLLSIPVELQAEVFRVLDPVSSTCLGLTCKDFYAVHKSVKGVVKLSERFYGAEFLTSSWYGRSELGFVLEDWAGDDLRYSTSSRTFVKRDELPTHKMGYLTGGRWRYRVVSRNYVIC